MNKKLKNKLYNARDNQWVGVIFSVPFIIGFLVIFLPMLINSLSFSFNEIVINESGYEKVPVKWENYYYALRVDSGFVRSLWSELSSMVASTPVITLFSLFIAVILNRKLPGRNAFRAIFFIPVILGVGVLSKLDSNNSLMAGLSSAAIDTGLGSDSSSDGNIVGNITAFLQSMNFSTEIIDFVSSMANSITNIVNQSGVQILISLAALQSISPSVYEAAQVEGATAWEVFWKITFPMVLPVMAINVFYTVIAQLSDSTRWLPKYIQQVTDVRGFGVGAALSWIYIACVLVMIGIAVLLGYFVVKLKNRA
ncbi:MAG: sugar ABC transporter permease [Clostridia bacterium]|nr:sugar ABC transporter permease [Clostridia bacterium]